MHIHLPKPIHGWRALAGEVGVIVIAVLLALGAEQVVESIRWRQDVRETRDALNAEIAANAAQYEVRIGHQKCLDERLAELDAMLASWNAGQTPDRTEQPIVAEPYSSSYTSVWNVAVGGSGAASLPLQDRLRYGVIYDEIANNARLGQEERLLWRKVAGFDGSRRLDGPSIIAFREALFGLRHLSKADRFNLPYFLRLIKPMHIRPRLIDTGVNPDEAPFCRPLLNHLPVAR